MAFLADLLALKAQIQAGQKVEKNCYSTMNALGMLNDLQCESLYHRVAELSKTCQEASFRPVVVFLAALLALDV